MGRKRDAVWAFFSDPIESESLKVKRASCKYCNGIVTGTTTNLKAHVLRCGKVPADHGIVPPPAVLKARRHSMLALGSSASTANAPLLQAIGNAAVSTGLKSKLDNALSGAIHRSCLPFDIFDHPAWREFFAKLRPDYALPSAHAIGSTLLDAEYAAVMSACKGELSASATAVLGIEAVTKSTSNVFAHTPYPWFMHNLHAAIHHDPPATVADRVASAIFRIKQFVETDFRVSGFVSDSSKNMCDVRGLLLERKVVLYAYGCSVQPLNSFCRDILSKQPFRQLVKQGVFVSKTVKLDAFLSSLFESICFEKMLSSLRMVLYSRSKWSSCNTMFTRLLKTKTVLMMLPIRRLQDREARGIDDTYELPADFFASISSSKFWTSMETAVTILSPICHCIEALEADQATLSLTYAVFLYLSARLSDPTDGLGLLTNAKELREKLLQRWDKIYSPVHALAFYCDPLFSSLRARVLEQGGETLDLGHGDLRVQCDRALQMLAAGDAALEAQLLTEFSDFSSESTAGHPLLTPDRDRAASAAWAEVGDVFPALSPVLAELFRASATAGRRGAPSAEINRRLYASARATIGTDRVERQDAIAHNSQHLERVSGGGSGGAEAPGGRVGGFENVVASYGAPEAALVLAEFTQQRELAGARDDGDEEEELLRGLDQAKCIDEIAEALLFAVEHDGDA